MSEIDIIKHELGRLIDDAFKAHTRGEYYGEVIRLKPFPDKPDWKVGVVWAVESDCPTVVIKQRAI